MAPAHPQLYPLQLNEQTREPYLRLPAPHMNIIITPPRITDKPAVFEILNDSRVWSQLASIPHPYTEAHAEGWLQHVKGPSDALLQELEEAGKNGQTELKIVEGCPVRTLREVKESGEEVFLGDCTVIRSTFMEVSDKQERERLKKANDEKKLGDPQIIWAMGDYLAPSHHGRGIMTAVIATLLREWAIPRMAVRRMIVNAHKGNIGSVRTFEKNGFKLKETVDDCLELTAEGRTGGPKMGLHILEWRYDDSEVSK